MTFIAESPPIVDSLLTKFDLRARLVSFAIAVIAMAALRSLPAAAVCLAGTAAILAAARLPARLVWRRLGVVALALAPVIILMPLLQGPDGLQVALLLGAKAAAITALGLAFIGTAPLMSMAWAARKLGVPTALVRIGLLSRRYSFVLADEWTNMRSAAAARGFRPGSNLRTMRTLGGQVGTMLVRGAARADRVAQAQHCRGDDGQFHMLDPSRFRWRDAALASGMALLAALVLIWDSVIVR